MVLYFAHTVAVTYPQDNAQLAEAFGDMIALLETEADAPFYLDANNRFDAETTLELDQNIWAIGGVPGLDAASDTATVIVRNRSTLHSGGSTVAARGVGYSLWEPVTIKTLLGSEQIKLQTSSEVFGPAVLGVGGQAQFSVPYRGYSRNFVSLFKPHYLTVETMIGPWRVGSVTKPFYVWAPGEIFRPLNLSPPITLSESTGVVSPVAGKAGRLRAADLQSPSATTTLVEDTLSAQSPSLSATFSAETNLWAIDLRLFAPPEADVALLVTDSQGRRLGYDSTNGMIYNELTGFVTDTGLAPISIRLLKPPTGESYTVTVSLLNPGAKPVSVGLFQENEAVSDALMVAYPSRVVVDSATSETNPAVSIRVSEGSQQQPLTNVTATLTNLVEWNGSETVAILTNQSQVLGDIGAGESLSASWPVGLSQNTKPGKYTGTAVLTSGQTVDLTVPVVALARSVTDTVSLFGGTNQDSGTLQIEIPVGTNGTGETWVHVPRGFFVLHASLGLAPASTNLQNPTIDIGADGNVDWAFSGRLDVGLALNHVEKPFNDFLKAHPAAADGTLVPIRVAGNEGESLLLGGLQLYLERIPSELRFPEVMGDGTTRFTLVAYPDVTYRIEASSDLINWTTVKTIVPTEETTQVVDDTAVGQSHRFYRAVTE